MPKYYKILNERECHYGLQYKTGLNVDPEPFERLQCVPGGIHFSDAQDIMEWAWMGPWIREVTLPEDAVIASYVYKSKADKVILGERRKLASKEVIEELIKNGFELEKSSVIATASVDGHYDLIKVIAPYVKNTTEFYQEKLLYKITNNDKALKIILPYINKNIIKKFKEKGILVEKSFKQKVISKIKRILLLPEK